MGQQRRLASRLNAIYLGYDETIAYKSVVHWLKRSIAMEEYSGSIPEKCDHKIPLTSNYNLLKMSLTPGSNLGPLTCQAKTLTTLP